MRRVNGTTDAVVGTALAVVNLEGYLVCGVGGMRRVNETTDAAVGTALAVVG